MRYLNNVLAYFLLVSAVAINGCKKDDSGPTGSNQAPDRRGTYKGVVTDPAGGGTVTMNVGVALGKVNDIITVSGAYTPIGGAAVMLTGTYNTTNDSLYVAGGSYVFTGHFSRSQISGAFAGPNGSGLFSIAPTSSTSPVRTFTGTYQLTSGGHGPFNLLITGAALSGVALDVTDNSTTQLTGSVNGSAVTLYEAGYSSGPVIATGTISGSNIGGATYSFTSGQPNGSWSGVLVP